MPKSKMPEEKPKCCTWALSLFIFSVTMTVLLTTAAIVIGPIKSWVRVLNWDPSWLKPEDFVPTQKGKPETAKKMLHVGSRWDYLDQQGWDNLVLKGLGYQGRAMCEKPNQNLKIFEIGSGTGAALSTLVRTYPDAVKEVYGIEPAKRPNDICEKYFAQEHPGLFKSPEGEPDKVICGYANHDTMKHLPDNYYDQVMANGVLCLLPNIQTLKEVVAESIRILRPGGILSATVLIDDEEQHMGYGYGCITLATSRKKFWEALQKELGYSIISIDTMGMWEGHARQKSRYAIQIRKNPESEQPAATVAETDLSEAEKVSKPSHLREVRWVVILCAILAVGFLALSLTIFFLYIRRSEPTQELGDEAA